MTCGGLCPGMNTVIRELVVGLWELYGVRRIYGILAGYRGFYTTEAVELNLKLVDNWHKRGGTALRTSRGGFDLRKIVDAIQNHGFNQVFPLFPTSYSCLCFFNFECLSLILPFCFLAVDDVFMIFLKNNENYYYFHFINELFDFSQNENLFFY